jgi:hypothetical protein
MSERNKSKVRSIRGMKRIYSDEMKTGSTNIFFAGWLGAQYHYLVVEYPFFGTWKSADVKCPTHARIEAPKSSQQLSL